MSCLSIYLLKCFVMQDDFVSTEESALGGKPKSERNMKKDDFLVVGIKDLDVEDRPREKLLTKGRKSLSNAELLAILIGSGNRNESAVQLSQRILVAYDNRLEKLAKADVSQLTSRFQGIGEAKAISILAGLELSRRVNYESVEEVVSIRSSLDIYNAIKPQLVGSSQEEVWAIYTNTVCHIIEKKNFCIGGSSGCIIDVKMIVREAINLKASGLVLIHNHPSGTPNPSEQDRVATRKMQETCRMCDLTLIDHLIFCDAKYFSFFDEGLLR